MLVPNELQDVTDYGLRSDFLSPETKPKATVELALTKNRKLLLACMLVPVFYLFTYLYLKISSNPSLYLFDEYKLIVVFIKRVLE